MGINRFRQTSLAVYPGSFDPVTYGHLDIIRRASSLFNKVVVAVNRNVDKDPLFSPRERKELVELALGEIKLAGKVRVDVFDGLLVDYLKTIDARIVIRGLRFISDFEYEFQMALINRHLFRSIETVYLMPDEKYLHLSSSIVKEIAAFGQVPKGFVPKCVARALLTVLKDRQHAS